MKKLSLFAAVLTAGIAAQPLTAQVDITARGATLRVGGRLHTQYQSSSAENSPADFFIRRARVNVDVTINDFLSARVQPEYSGGSAKLVDAYVRFDLADDFQLYMGQMKRPFDIFDLDSSTDMSIIERDGGVEGVDTCAGVGGVCTFSRFSKELDLGNRDQGLRADLGLGRVFLSASLTNGTGTNTSDDNDEKTVMGRVAFEATEQITVAGQFARKDYVDGVSDEFANVWSVDAQYGGYRDGLLVQGAVMSGDNWRLTGTGGDPATFIAWQVIGSYYLPLATERFTGWEPVFRVSAGDPDTDVDDNGGLVWTPGLMLYIQGKNKFGFNLDYYTPDEGDAEWSLKVQSFIYF